MDSGAMYAILAAILAANIAYTALPGARYRERIRKLAAEKLETIHGIQIQGAEAGAGADREAYLYLMSHNSDFNAYVKSIENWSNINSRQDFKPAWAKSKLNRWCAGFLRHNIDSTICLSVFYLCCIATLIPGFYLTQVLSSWLYTSESGKFLTILTAWILVLTPTMFTGVGLFFVRSTCTGINTKFEFVMDKIDWQTQFVASRRKSKVDQNLNVLNDISATNGKS